MYPPLAAGRLFARGAAATACLLATLVATAAEASSDHDQGPRALFVPPTLDEVHGLIDIFRPVIAARLGGDIPDPVDVALSASVVDDDGNPAYAEAIPTWAGGGYAGCTVTFSTVAPANADFYELADTAAHELFHCFQFAHQSETLAGATPKWITEGAANWAGHELTASSVVAETGFWEFYLAHPETPLFTREYDAMGFFAHLDEIGIDPWLIFEDMWAVGNDSPAAFAASGANGDAFMKTWASGLSRQPERGPTWDTNSPSITDDAAEPEAASIGDGIAVALTTPAFTNKLVQLGISAEIVKVTASGYTRMSDGTLDVPKLTNGVYCAKPGGCGTCPDGSPIPGNPAQLGPDPLVALSSNATPTAVTFTGMSVKDYCTANPVYVFYDRPASTGLNAGRIVEFYACQGPFGPWVGNVWFGGVNIPGAEMEFIAAPVSFTVSETAPTAHVTASASVIVEGSPMDMTFAMDVTVVVDATGQATMALTNMSGSGAWQGLEMEIPGDGYNATMPVEPAPEGTCA